MKRKKLWVAALVAAGILLAMGLAGCGDSVEEETDQTVEEVTEEPVGEAAANDSIVKRNVEVEAIIAGIEKQVYTDEEGEEENADTVWVYYSDGTFEQFAEIEDETVLFSRGTYELEKKGFILEEGATDFGKVTINLTEKFEYGKGLVPNESSNTCSLSSLGPVVIYAPDKDKKAVTMFAGHNKQPYEEADGDQEQVDAWWVFYSNGTFEEYAEIDDEIVAFSTGSYELEEGGDFNYEGKGEYPGVITINQTKKYIAGQGLTDFVSTHSFELASMGLTQLFVIE